MYRDALGVLGNVTVINGKIVTTTEHADTTIENNSINLLSFMAGG